jgi:CHAT domain-containing protein
VLVRLRRVVVCADSLPQLPHALAEISSIETLIANKAVIQSDVPDQTVDSVLRLIPQADIVHFACHGRQMNADPLQSGFELSDGRLTLSHLMGLHIPRGQLAYLSACESAAVDANQPDEAVNIATAMLYVGFKSIIATLW